MRRKKEKKRALTFVPPFRDFDARPGRQRQRKHQQDDHRGGDGGAEHERGRLRSLAAPVIAVAAAGGGPLARAPRSARRGAVRRLEPGPQQPADRGHQRQQRQLVRPLERRQRRDAGEPQHAERARVDLAERDCRGRRGQESSPADFSGPVGRGFFHREEDAADRRAEGRGEARGDARGDELAALGVGLEDRDEAAAIVSEAEALALLGRCEERMLALSDVPPAASAATSTPPLGDPLRRPVRQLPRRARGVRAQRGDTCANVHERSFQTQSHAGGHGESGPEPLDGERPALKEPGDGVAVEVGHDLE